jgi:hypothetical protein
MGCDAVEAGRSVPTLDMIVLYVRVIFKMDDMLSHQLARSKHNLAPVLLPYC